MLKHRGSPLDAAFPVRITPNKPPIVPHGATRTIVDGKTYEEYAGYVRELTDDRDGQGGGSD